MQVTAIVVVHAEECGVTMAAADAREWPSFGGEHVANIEC
jgi:hypothetical protein